MRASLGQAQAQLTHNAFEAVTERSGMEAPENCYRPILQITTGRDGAHVEITTWQTSTRMRYCGSSTP